jgi:hypothetical protein
MPNAHPGRAPGDPSPPKFTVRKPDHLDEAREGITMARTAGVLGPGGVFLADALEHILVHLSLPAGAREHPVSEHVVTGADGSVARCRLPRRIASAEEVAHAVAAAGFRVSVDTFDKPTLFCNECGRDCGFHKTCCSKA